MNSATSRSLPAATASVCGALARDELCVPCELARAGVSPAGTAVRQVRRHAVLHAQGQPFAAAYAVRAGSFKSVLHTDGGGEQVVGFHLGAELVGLDGLARDRHETTAVALEDSEVLVLPLADPGWWSHASPGLPQAIARLLARENVRERQRRQQLAGRSAEARLAAFLLEQSRSMQARGYSGGEFHLRMTRSDIGSYLGLQLETISRVFARLRQKRVLQAQQRHVRILDLEALALAAETPPAAASAN